MRREAAAAIVSELLSPWVINFVFFLILGASTKAWPAALIAGLGTGPVIMVAILAMMRLGKVGNHHVTQREQRGQVLAVVFIIVALTLCLLWVVTTPHVIWAGMTSALVFLIGFGLVTVVGKIKASIHVGLWVCLVTFLTLAINPWWSLAYVITPLSAWSRIVIKHHTVGEVMAGVVTAVAVTAPSVWWFLM